MDKRKNTLPEGAPLRSVRVKGSPVSSVSKGTTEKIEKRSAGLSPWAWSPGPDEPVYLHRYYCKDCDLISIVKHKDDHVYLDECVFCGSDEIELQEIERE